jgi:4-carboxymuconolactone decarboxylase
MARLPYVDLDAMSPAYRELLASRRPLNLYRLLPHAPAACEPFLALGGALLRKSELDPVLREVAILRVGFLSRASYEVHQHKRLARSLGMSDATIAAIELGPDAPGLSASEDLVLRFTDQLVRHVKAPNALFDEVRQALGERPLAELVLTIGFYMMVSRFLENFEVDVEPHEALA